MFNAKPQDQATIITEQAARTAEEAIKATQRAADEALESLAQTVESIRGQTAPWLRNANREINSFAHRGMETLHDAQAQINERAMHAKRSTEQYVAHDPIKALLIAAASGAALMALVSLATRSSRS